MDQAYWFDLPVVALADYGIAGHNLPPGITSIVIPMLYIQQ